MRTALLFLFALTGCYYVPGTNDTGDTTTGDTGYTATGDTSYTSPADTSTVDCSDAVAFGSEPDVQDPVEVYGYVTSPSGTLAVAGAKVSTTVSGEQAWTLTDPRGCFRLDLPAGTHDLSVTEGRYAGAKTVDVPASDMVDAGTIPLDGGDAHLAVVKGQYDDVGQLLSDIGVPFDGFASPKDLFEDPATLARYDVVFVNCGTRATATNQESYTTTEFDNVRAWLQAGGTLYASDWEYELVQGVDPDALAFADDPHIGTEGTVDAQLLDRDLIQLVGADHVQIHFDMPQWVVIDHAGTATPLVEADLPGGLGTHPLAAMQYEGSGRMVYTSFHNEPQITDDMEQVLYALILSL